MANRLEYRDRDNNKMVVTFNPRLNTVVYYIEPSGARVGLNKAQQANLEQNVASWNAKPTTEIKA